jgi:hypothetical protein
MERVAPVVPGTYTDPDSCVFGAHKHLDNAIRDHARKIAYHLPEFRRLIIQAKADGLHTMLGFKSWTAYVADVIGTEMTALPVEDRRQIVELLSGEGMSNRAIAEAVGVSHPTVIRDKAAIEAEVVHDVPPERGGDEVVRDVPPESVTVVGRDNKTYPAKRRTLDEINAERAARGQPPVQKARKFTPREKVEREAKAIAADIRSIVTRLRELKAADRALNEGYRWSEQEDAYDDIEDALEALRNWYNS